MSKPRKPAISVLGAGAWGTALAIAMTRSHSQVRLWSICSEDIQQMRQSGYNKAYLGDIKLPTELELHDDLADATAGVEDLLIVVPSAAFSSMLEQLKSLDNWQDFAIAWGTKGIDPKSHHLLQQCVIDIMGPDTPTAVVSGPSFAKEVANGAMTRLSVASRNKGFRQRLQQALSSNCLNIELSDDVIGVQICGCAKNVFAILVGICHGLGWSDNTRAALITLIFKEMQQLLISLGGHAETIYTAAGVGDLILTCCNEQSRNHQFGLALAQTQSVEQAQQKVGKLVEGYHNSAQLFLHMLKENKKFPVLAAAYDILYLNKKCEDRLHQLLHSS